MDAKKFDAMLEKAQKEIQKAERVDEKGRALLQSLEKDIQEALARTGEEKSASSLAEKLRNAMDHFEMSHPTLTAALSDLFTILSNAGI